MDMYYFIRGTTVKKWLSCSYNIYIIYILFMQYISYTIYVSDYQYMFQIYNICFRYTTYVSELSTYIANSEI
jgi:hypothetical protein